jgi:hypothetical protein
VGCGVAPNKGATSTLGNPVVAQSWQQHETLVTQALRSQNPGAPIGRQVTLDVTNVRSGVTETIRIDNTVPQNGVYQLVDAKFSGVRDLTQPTVNLTSTVTQNQQAVYSWISGGQPVVVVPRGANAVKAGMTPGVPINVAPTVQIHVNAPSGGTVVRTY